MVELSKGTVEQQNLSIKLIQQHNLFNTGMKLYRQNAEFTKKVKIALGEYLLGKKELQQAELAFESAGEHERALQIAIDNFDVQRSLDIGRTLLQFSPEQIRELILSKILEHAQEVSNHQVCGKVFKKLGNYEKAIESFIKCESWKNCVKCAHYLPPGSREQLRGKIIDALKLAANIKSNQMKKNISDFVEKKQRLRVVQDEKRNKPMLMNDMGLGLAQQKDSELYSDISESQKTSNESTTSFVM